MGRILIVVGLVLVAVGLLKVDHFDVVVLLLSLGVGVADGYAATQQLIDLLIGGYWLQGGAALAELALGSLVFRGAFAVTRRFQRCVPSLFYSYVWWHSRTRGFLQARQDDPKGRANARERGWC